MQFTDVDEDVDDALALFQAQKVYVDPETSSSQWNLNSEMAWDSKNAFLHCEGNGLDPMMHLLQVGEEVAKHLKESGVEVKDYNALLGDIKTLAQTHTKLWADPTKASLYMQLLYNSRACVVS